MALFFNGSATIDEQMGLRKADDAFYKCMGQNVYGSICACIHPEDFHRFKEASDAVKNGSIPQNIIAVRKLNSDNSYEWLLIELSLEPFNLNGRPLFHLNLASLTEEQTVAFQLRQLKEEYEAFFNLLGSTLLTYHSATGLLDISINCDGQILSLFHDTLPAWEDIYGQKLDPEYINEFHTLCREIETGKQRFQHRIMTNAFSKDGAMELYAFKCQSIPGQNSDFRICGCISALSSNTQKTALNTSYSMDTGIPILNKKAITEYAKESFLAASNKIHLIILDLDDFKTINDTYGHLFGDEVLLKSANIIKETIGNSGIVGRIGGDEMMIVLTRIESHAELRNMLRSIRTGIEWAHKQENDNLRVTCSMGVATYPDHGDDYDKIFQLADRMLYIAKNKGKNRYVIYTPELHDCTVSAKIKPDKCSSLENLRDDKAGVMQRLVNEFLIRKIIPYATELSEIGYCFDLDEIILVYGDMKMSTTWNHEGYFNDIEDKDYLTLEPAFLEDFDQNNILAVNGIFNLEGKAPILAGLLTKRGVESALFYKMVKNGIMFGYIMFAKKDHRQMWSEYDKTLLATVGKVIELSFIGK